MKMIKSGEFELIYQDIKKAIFNAFVFGSPLLLLVLIELQKGNSFEEIKLLVIAWVMQTSIDLLKKFISVNKYEVKK